MIGKAKAQQKLIDNLDTEFVKVWILLYISPVSCMCSYDNSLKLKMLMCNKNC